MNENLQNLIGHAQAGLEKAAEIRRSQLAQARKVEQMIPRAVQTLVDNNRISPLEAEKTARYITDHAQAIDLITMLAAQNVGTDKTVYDVGTTCKSAASQQESADAVWFSGLGLQL